MSENLDETNQFTNHTNGTYLFQPSPSTLGMSHYGVPNVNSIQSSPISPHLNHEPLVSPITPGNELSPMLDMPDSAMTWEYNQFGRTAPSSWGSSSQDELSETSGCSRIYPFNSTLTSKDNGNAHCPQRLDSFSKAFLTKNLYLYFGDSNRTDDKNSENNHISGVLQLPQSGTLSEGLDRQPLESPIFNPIGSIQAQTQPICDQSGFCSPDIPLHGTYQNHQQFHYGDQQHKPKVTNMEQANRGLHKPQSPWHHQHGYQVHQSHLTPFPMTLQQQHQLHLQHGGTFARKTHLNSQEAYDSSQSPIYGHNQDFKTLEQHTLQSSHSLNLPSPHYQDQQHIRALSNPNDPYLHQQPQERVQSISLNQNSMFDDGRLALFDKHSAANTPVYSSPQEDGQSGFNFPGRNEDLCSPHYQSKRSGGCKGAPQMTIRGDIFTHLNSHTPHWSQAASPDIHDEVISPQYRAETGLMSRERSHAKMTCTVCQREFKSLPALNGHMRSHGGCRTHQSSLKMQKDGQIHLSSGVSQIKPIILPVSVPVKDCLVNSKLNRGSQCHQKEDDQHALIKSCAQSPLPSVQNHPSCIKRSVSNAECAPKPEKKRYRHCLVPLMIPPPSGGQESRGAVLFRSLLRSASSTGDDVPYTPPPMLSPVRPGSGLFTAINGRGKIGMAESAINAHHSPASDLDSCAVTSAEKAINLTPRINIGEEFQATIPGMKNQSITGEDTHNAVLLWTPTEDLENADNQQKVDNLLKMACSSVLPGGGTNTEYVLHCLFECRGDTMNTLERLLLPTLWKNGFSFKTDYHYAGSDKWTLQEKRQLNKALLIHQRDFYLVQKMVKTKSVSQCVEYYYTWKKRLRLCTRVSTTSTAPVQNRQGNWAMSTTARLDKVAKGQTKNSELSDNSNTLFVCEVTNSMNGETWNQNKVGLLCSSPAEHKTPTLTQALGLASVRSSPSNSTTSGDTDSALIFPCTECGKVFMKVKSRNAHMKKHRQHEDTQLRQFPRVPEQANVILTPGCPVTHLKQPLRLHSLPFDSIAEVKSLNAESVQEMDCHLKNLPVLQSPMDYMTQGSVH
ncbi:transcriptional-regulating factor 1 isoform X3 [Xyrauchen texanus]|uniref:transcriptional-regulating factor 1 isoform X3 n=1 Tax=Xyrauchen texanus TaxID=154827 RepID=UPI0022429856|nr:transcriptional-regulating factor 1 isoform X3 [Xyrauchen texanus]